MQSSLRANTDRALTVTVRRSIITILGIFALSIITIVIFSKGKYGSHRDRAKIHHQHHYRCRQYRHQSRHHHNLRVPRGQTQLSPDRVTCQAFAPPPTFSHDLVSAQGGEIKIIITITIAVTVTIVIIFTRLAQGNEMKIQKVFEAFEQFRLGEENIAHLVTQLEASLMQVIYCNWASIIESAGQSL